jgi:cystathionine gamma-lyase
VTDNYHLDTLAIHAGQEPDPTTGAIMTPIYQTSTYAQTAPAEHKGYEYSRTDNPTRTALQELVAAIEGGRYGLAFASGMAATDTALRLLNPGDHVIVGNDVYGGTYRLFEGVYARYGLRFDWIDLADVDAVRAALTPANAHVVAGDADQSHDAAGRYRRAGRDRPAKRAGGG